ncbi:MAG: hypothetical protein AVDCRST_MAG16-1941, partial [uncultured Frankineae bacterium]
ADDCPTASTPTTATSGPPDRSPPSTPPGPQGTRRRATARM